MVGADFGDRLAWAAGLGPHAVNIQIAASKATCFTTCLDTTIRGAVRLLGGPWELEVRPERGGRITSLRLAGEELLDQGIGVDDAAAAGFVEGGAWGWDEMVPNVEPGLYPGTGPWQGTELPDHGEAWRLHWSASLVEDNIATMTCSGTLLPWRLERRLELTERAVRASYRYTNEGGQPIYAYWCAHPLFRYEAGMRVEAGAEPFAAPASGASAKIFLPPGSVDRARLAWPSGTAIEVAWDVAATPYASIWACDGDLGGYHQIAVEPATGGNDRPDPAAPAPLIGPGEELRWWIEVRDRRHKP
jgi:galactose mutarotase-like enzyme